MATFTQAQGQGLWPTWPEVSLCGPAWKKYLLCRLCRLSWVTGGVLGFQFPQAHVVPGALGERLPEGPSQSPFEPRARPPQRHCGLAAASRSTASPAGCLVSRARPSRLHRSLLCVLLQMSAHSSGLRWIRDATCDFFCSYIFL